MLINTVKKYVGIVSAGIAFLVSFYILLGMLNMVPLISYYVLGETLLRLLAQIAILFFLIAACAFWEI